MHLSSSSLKSAEIENEDDDEEEDDCGK